MKRGLITVIFCFGCVLPAGCDKTELQPFWDKTKITELDTSRQEQTAKGKLQTANFDVHIYEVPADNFAKLRNVWESVHTRPIRFYNYRAFAGNHFRAGLGRRFTWSGIEAALQEAGGKKMVTIALLIPKDSPQDFRVTSTDRPGELSYTGLDGLQQKKSIGPGIVGLRFKAKQAAGHKNMCEVVGYPVFGTAGPRGKGPMAEHTRQREIEFKAAGFGAKMGMDDFIVLGPAKYLSEQETLGGLVFSNLIGTEFLLPKEPPRQKISVRIFVMVCTAVRF